MAIVDRTQGYIPTLKKDIFSDAFYNPVYSEESQKNGGAERTLIGSAATVTLAEPDEKISMVKIDPRKSIDCTYFTKITLNFNDMIKIIKKEINSSIRFGLMS